MRSGMQAVVAQSSLFDETPDTCSYNHGSDNRCSMCSQRMPGS